MRRLLALLGLIVTALLAAVAHKSVALQGPPWVGFPKRADSGVTAGPGAARNIEDPPPKRVSGRGSAARSRVTPPAVDLPSAPPAASLPDSASALNAVDESIAVTVRVVSAPPSTYQFALRQNQPNPCQGSTQIRYSIARRVRFTITLYSVTGQRVATLVDEIHEPGEYSTRWDGTDETGRPAPPGVYIYRARGGGFAATRKLIMR